MCGSNCCGEEGQGDDRRKTARLGGSTAASCAAERSAREYPRALIQPQSYFIGDSKKSHVA